MTSLKLFMLLLGCKRPAAMPGNTTRQSKPLFILPAETKNKYRVKIQTHAAGEDVLNTGYLTLSKL